MSHHGSGKNIVKLRAIDTVPCSLLHSEKGCYLTSFPRYHVMSCGGLTDKKTAKDPSRAYAWLPLVGMMTTKHSDVYGISLHLLAAKTIIPMTSIYTAVEYKRLVISIHITVAETCQASVIYIQLLTMRAMGCSLPRSMWWACWSTSMPQ